MILSNFYLNDVIPTYLMKVISMFAVHTVPDDIIHNIHFKLHMITCF